MVMVVLLGRVLWLVEPFTTLDVSKSSDVQANTIEIFKIFGLRERAAVIWLVFTVTIQLVITVFNKNVQFSIAERIGNFRLGPLGRSPYEVARSLSIFRRCLKTL